MRPTISSMFDSGIKGSPTEAGSPFRTDSRPASRWFHMKVRHLRAICEMDCFCSWRGSIWHLLLVPQDLRETRIFLPQLQSPKVVKTALAKGPRLRFYMKPTLFFECESETAANSTRRMLLKTSYSMPSAEPAIWTAVPAAASGS